MAERFIGTWPNYEANDDGMTLPYTPDNGVGCIKKQKEKM